MINHASKYITMHDMDRTSDFRTEGYLEGVGYPTVTHTLTNGLFKLTI